MANELKETLVNEEIVETARSFIHAIGGFEKFAEWGLVW